MVTLSGRTTFVAHDGAGALDLAAQSRPHARVAKPPDPAEINRLLGFSLQYSET